MEIPFKGQYDRATFFRAVRLANRPARRSNWVQWLVMGAVAAVILLSGQSTLQNGWQDWGSTIRLGLAVGLLAAFLGWPYALSYWQASRLWKDPAIRQVITGRVQERGITYTNTSPYRTVAWSSYARLRLSPDLAALLTPGGVLTVFPRRFFKTDADWQSFCQLVQRKIIKTV